MSNGRNALFFEHPFIIRDKTNFCFSISFETYIKQNPVRLLPNSMKLSFNENTRHFPNEPPVLHAATGFSHLSFHVTKAIVDIRIQARVYVYKYGFTDVAKFSA